MKKWLIFFKPAVPKQWLYFAIALVWIYASFRIFMLAWDYTIANKISLVIFAFISLLGSYLFTKLVFLKVTKRYITRIYLMVDERPCLFSMFSPKSYLLIIFMISLGIFMKYFTFIPGYLLALFYGSLGLSLFTSAILFIRAGSLSRTT